MPRAVTDGNLRLAAQRNVCQHFEINRVDDGDVAAAPIEAIDALELGFVQNCIGVVARNADGIDYLQGFQIKDRDSIRTPIAGESPLRVLSECHAVHAGGSFDLTDQFFALDVPHLNPVAASNKQPLPELIECNKVPASVATYRDALCYSVTARSRPVTQRCAALNEKQQGRRGDEKFSA